MVSVWVALSDVTAEAGPVLLAPGSQNTKNGFLRHIETGTNGTKAAGNLLSRGQEIAPGQIDLSEQATVPALLVSTTSL